MATLSNEIAQFLEEERHFFENITDEQFRDDLEGIDYEYYTSEEYATEMKALIDVGLVEYQPEYFTEEQRKFLGYE